MSNVSPIKNPPKPKAPRLLLTELPEETPQRVACVLKYLAACPRNTDLSWTDDEEFGRFILLQDCAAALMALPMEKMNAQYIHRSEVDNG